MKRLTLEFANSIRPTEGTHYSEADARLFLADALWGAGRKVEAAAEWMTVSKMTPSYPSYEQPIEEAKRRLAERPPT